MGLSSWTSSIIVKEKDRREPDRRLIVEKLAKNHAATFTRNTLRLDPDIVTSSSFAGTNQFTANNEHLLKLLRPSREKPRTSRWTRRTHPQPNPRPPAPRDPFPHPSPLISVLNSCKAMGEDENRRRRASL